MPEYPEGATLRAARASYFEENGFGDGGYAKRFVRIQLGPVPIWILNTRQRVRSVRLHDLHHVLTGYGTDVLGEGEIGAFEIASGCADHAAAWYLNLCAVAIALPLGPRALARAFARGRRSRNLYAGEWDEALLDERVGALRARLPIAPPVGEPAPRERAAFAAWALAGALVFVGPLALVPALLLLLLL